MPLYQKIFIAVALPIVFLPVVLVALWTMGNEEPLSEEEFDWYKWRVIYPLIALEGFIIVDFATRFFGWF